MKKYIFSAVLCFIISNCIAGEASVQMQITGTVKPECTMKLGAPIHFDDLTVKGVNALGSVLVKCTTSGNSAKIYIDSNLNYDGNRHLVHEQDNAKKISYTLYSDKVCTSPWPPEVPVSFPRATADEKTVDICAKTNEVGIAEGSYSDTVTVRIVY